jgi:CheY-like chemotaxis protein
MEAIGRLAGGVAHDFNNLLTTMSGNAELIILEGKVDDPTREMVEEILGSAARAASLTRQLLAFSRKQVTQPKVLDINESISGIERMLVRLIGEDIALETELESPLANIRADPSHIEQVIMNLSVNARDAMPRGGLLTLRTKSEVLLQDQPGDLHEDVPAGDYVQVSVSDTGIGMEVETLKKIFEPFFTMKEVGKGTGLGLATVYGLVRQAEGYISVYSRPGLGTTFKILFPAVDEEQDPCGRTEDVVALAPGKETVLVAEDQEDVLHVTQKILERCGYQVLSAVGAEEALAIAARYGKTIHMLLTDVVMPGLSGPELADELVAHHPETTVVYMSGYTDDQLQNHGVLHSGITLIEKPFTSVELTQTVRTALDRRASTIPQEAK